MQSWHKIIFTEEEDHPSQHLILLDKSSTYATTNQGSEELTLLLSLCSLNLPKLLVQFVYSSDITLAIPILLYYKKRKTSNKTKLAPIHSYIVKTMKNK